jgi:hypothetical protein
MDIRQPFPDFVVFCFRINGNAIVWEGTSTSMYAVARAD